MLESAAEKDRLLRTKITTIGNIVHDSVPISNNEVCGNHSIFWRLIFNTILRNYRITTQCSELGHLTA